MSLELYAAFRNCRLESRGRRAVLLELIRYCDDETGETRIGRTALAFYTALSVKGALRLVRELAEDPDLAGLVRRERFETGTGREIVCRLDMARLRPLLPGRSGIPGGCLPDKPGGKATPAILAAIAGHLEHNGAAS